MPHRDPLRLSSRSRGGRERAHSPGEGPYDHQWSRERQPTDNTKAQPTYSPEDEGMSLTPPPAVDVAVDTSRCPVTGGMKVPKEADPKLVHFRLMVTTAIAAVVPHDAMLMTSSSSSSNVNGVSGASGGDDERSDDASKSWSFTQWQSLASVDRLWEALSYSFRGYVLPPLSSKPVPHFAQSRQQLWLVHYALRSLAFANEGSMMLMEPFVQFLTRGQCIQEAELNSSTPPLSMSPQAKTPHSSSPATNSTGNGASHSHSMGDPTSSTGTTMSSPSPSDPTAGGSSPMRVHATLNSTLHRRDYEHMSSLSIKLLGLTKTTGFRSKPQTDLSSSSSRQSFVIFITKRTLEWQRVAAEASHVAGMVVRYAQDHEKRCQGTRSDVRSIRTQIGRPRLAEKDIVLGGRVENVGGAQGTILSVGDANDSKGQPLVGVCWDTDGVGLCDGTFDGIKYFHCDPQQGAFVNPQNLFTPLDEDDVLFTLCEAISAVDSILHPASEGVPAAVNEIACQLATALQFHASFYQAFANTASELVSVHKTMLQGEAWLAVEAKKGKGSKSSSGPFSSSSPQPSSKDSKEVEVQKVVDVLAGEWWLATRAFSDGVLAFQPSFRAHRVEIAALFHRLHQHTDLTCWGLWSRLPHVMSGAVDPTADFASLSRIFRVAGVQ